MRSLSPVRFIGLLGGAVIVAALFVASGSAQSTAPRVRAQADEFFIVSSVDISKNELLLKRPTEVTELVRVDGATRYLDEGRKSIALTDLRAGDTVYIASKPGTGGFLAVAVRKGPMTLDELRKRYLR